jgi:quercetin dioxygenase-like cupin family protein
VQNYQILCANCVAKTAIMPLFNIHEIPSCNLIEGYDAQFIHTANATYSHVKAKADAVLPTHSHPQEQVSYILDGTFELTVEGVKHVLEPGQVFVIPSNTKHSGLAITDCFILDVFTPLREDYREKGGINLG